MIKTFLTALLLLFFAAPRAHAASVTPSCSPIYGGGQSCVQSGKLSIDKTVKSPASDNFVDNMNLNETIYPPDKEITFKIVIKNNSSSSISNAAVQDIFPQFIDFKSGSGKYDSNSKTFSFTIDKVNANETKTYFIVGKTTTADKLPNTVCVINQAIVKANNETSRDNSQICIAKPGAPVEIQVTNLSPATSKGGVTTKPTATVKPTNPPTTKGGLPVYEPTQSKQTPATGPEALALIGLIPAGGLGMWLRKKTK